jgi:hypothetical protein
VSVTLDALYRETVIPFDQLDWLRPLGRRVPSTSLSVESVPIEVAMVIRGWDPESLVESVPPVYPTSAVEAVDFIRDLLMLPRTAVFAALDISEKSFHNWVRYGHRPRPLSTGTLWPMTEALYRLSKGHPNMAAWFHSEPAAEEAFHAGDVNALVLAELTWAVRTYAPKVRVTPDFDQNVEIAPPARTRTRMASGVAPTATRRKR